ncbi:alpha/beta hydrolase [Mesorhizobium sp. M7A.F.Ca.CA.001.09.2.1]|uniref:Alpha/beta hydrolase n=10 Tax=Mesorhizobium TaxID=68287 RepID=A0AB38TAA9_9HYPH|nr:MULTISPECIES: alpha/beta hydrolase [Mesorhizobium]MDF3213994.1 alpha/beta hydrolase [Mesorhizobium ciceri]RUY78451.1 alpha/beta hydrolase [Mesorhizobium sp. M7A.F.Ca.CA.001.09.2.1]RUZ08566.1 alpha/beta hydrolase [Mesorhizobium sp. M7A.F.Ca.CA.001.04.2.1]RVB54827.1 alpha/beta hydrolase [Mesorhizobium sp. M7A.F.Ca.CA.001.06.1.1]UTU51221.1 alpha/beta hydrolase [Mesorhizobium ciceri]
MVAAPTILLRDDASLRVFDTGQGRPPVVFQHGLGGDAAQVAQNFPDGPSYRRLTVECRAQGGSGAGSKRPFSIEMFADDVLAAADAAGLDRFVAGGISMGAAIALRLAARHPDRVTGLVLVRPAWAFDAASQNMRPYVEVAELIRGRPLDDARDAFAASATAARFRIEAPDNLASLLGFFARANANVFAEVMRAIANDGPGVTRAAAAGLALPTLVIGSGIDLVHPLATARSLADTIPNAAFVEVTPKATDKERHFAEIRAAIGGFLNTNFDKQDQS